MSTVITVQYHNVLRRAAGLGQKELCLPHGASVRDALNYLSETSGSALQALLLTPEGEVVPHLVVFRNRKLVTHAQFNTELIDGDELKLFPAISGG